MKQNEAKQNKPKLTNGIKFKTKIICRDECRQQNITNETQLLRIERVREGGVVLNTNKKKSTFHSILGNPLRTCMHTFIFNCTPTTFIHTYICMYVHKQLA